MLVSRFFLKKNKIKKRGGGGGEGRGGKGGRRKEKKRTIEFEVCISNQKIGETTTKKSKNK